MTFDQTPNIFDKVVTESLTGVVTNPVTDPRLWKNFNNPGYHPVGFVIF